MDKEDRIKPQQRHTDWWLWAEEAWEKAFEAVFSTSSQTASPSEQPGYFETKGPTGYERLQS